MFCPKCGDEYRDGFTVCAECHVPLARSRPVGPEHPDVTLVTVMFGRDESKLAVAKSLLNAAGIAFVARGEGLGHLGFIAGGIGPLTLQVSSADREAASHILRKLDEGA
jgi:hypothetical protein